MPKKASGTDIAATAQWQGQQHPLCPSASVVVAGPHLTEPKLLLSPEGGVIINIVMTYEALEHTTIRGGVEVVAVSGDIMNNYKE